MAEQRTTRHRAFHAFIPDKALEHIRAAHRELHKSAEALLPPGFLEHRRSARKEMLLAARSMIDAALEQTEKSED